MRGTTLRWEERERLHFQAEAAAPDCFSRALSEIFIPGMYSKVMTAGEVRCQLTLGTFTHGTSLKFRLNLQIWATSLVLGPSEHRSCWNGLHSSRNCIWCNEQYKLHHHELICLDL